jgi:hypothetical protein
MQDRKKGSTQKLSGAAVFFVSDKTKMLAALKAQAPEDI